MSPPFGIQRGLESDAVVELYAIAGEDFLLIVHHTVRKAGKAVAQGSDMGVHGSDAKIVTLFKEIVQTHLKYLIWRLPKIDLKGETHKSTGPYFCSFFRIKEQCAMSKAHCSQCVLHIFHCWATTQHNTRSSLESLIMVWLWPLGQ